MMTAPQPRVRLRRATAGPAAAALTAVLTLLLPVDTVAPPSVAATPVGGSSSQDGPRWSVDWPEDGPVAYDEELEGGFFVYDVFEESSFSFTLERAEGAHPAPAEFETALEESGDLEFYAGDWSVEQDYPLEQPPGVYTWRVSVEIRDSEGDLMWGSASTAVVERLANKVETTRFPSEITLDLQDHDVPMSRPVTVSGTVTGDPEAAAGRVVSIGLATIRRGTRHPVTSTTTDEDGDFAATVPTSWAYSREVVAWVDEQVTRVPRDPGDPRGPGSDFRVADAATTEAGPSVTVRPEPLKHKPRGKAKAFTLADRSMATFDACAPITYRINTNNMYRGFPRLLRKVFAEISAITGHTFVHDGRTTHTFLSKKGYPDLDPDVVLTIAFAKPRQLRDFKRSSALGIGGQRFAGGWATAGGAVFRVDDWVTRYRYPKPRRAVAGLVRHEIGHAMGLDHYADGVQVMHPGLLHELSGRFEAGDRAGLAALGTQVRGCREPSRDEDRVVARPAADSGTRWFSSH